MNQQETRDFKRKNYFAIPCFYDSHLHLEGLGKYSHKKDLSGLKSLEDIKAFLASIPLSLKTHEALGLPQSHTKDLNQFGQFLNSNGFSKLNLYWVLDDGHQLLVYGNLLLKFKEYLRQDSKNQNAFQSLMESSNPIWVFEDSTRNAFDTFYTQSEFKAEDSKMENHFLTAQHILLNAGVTHCRDLTSSLEQIQCLDRLYKKQAFHLYTETFFSDFFGDSVSSLIKSSNEAIDYLKISTLSKQNPLFNTLDKAAKTYDTSLVVNKLTHKGIKIFLDGTFSQGTADLTCFHKHSEESGLSHCVHGDRKYAIRDLIHFLKESSANNLEIAFHSMGDGAVELILKAFDEAKSEFKTKLNLEHCEIINKPSLDYLKNLDPKFKDKIVFHFQPSHFLMDYDTLLKIENQALHYYYIFAWSTLLKLGYKVHFGSDAPVVKPGLHFLTDAKFNSFLRSDDDYNLFWSTFSHPKFKQTPNTFTMFKLDSQANVFAPQSVLINSNHFLRKN